ncbi:MAG: hypothetical protein K6B44_02200 [Lachnospiraceae bacterium]|nr:hypothetical protein [Lachnospiraceae bacterium]
MRRKALFMLCALCMAAVTACGGEADTAAGRNVSNTKSVDDVLQERMEEEPAGEGSVEATTDTPERMPADDTEAIDVDLTALSSTMVYSEVSNMMTSPDEYIGKRVKMEGAYSLYLDPDSGNEYRACIIQDATACCAQGIEFETATPENCPGEGENVTVVGVFDTYYEGEYKYCTLRDAEVL